MLVKGARCSLICWPASIAKSTTLPSGKLRSGLLTIAPVTIGHTVNNSAKSGETASNNGAAIADLLTLSIAHGIHAGTIGRVEGTRFGPWRRYTVIGRVDEREVPMQTMGRETVRAVSRGIAGMGMLAALIAIGSRNLAHFDAALVGYTFATLFAVFAITYRYSMWLQRPPTALYWRRGWQVFFSRDRLLSNLGEWPKRVAGAFALNNFIFRRGRTRWAAHWLIMWGCLLAVAITFPLVFGWIHFQTPADDFERYRVYIFGFPTFSFRIRVWRCELGFEVSRSGRLGTGACAA